MKLLTLIAKIGIDYDDIPKGGKVENEIIDHLSGLGHDDKLFNLDWEDEKECPTFKKWLISEYGNDVKQYDEFVMLSC